MDLKSKIQLDRLPRHIAIIMDGNGRWAKEHGKPRVFGHKQGVISVREITESAAEIGLKYLTLYAFSTENWNRPRFEVNALMELLVDTLHREIDTLNENNIRLRAIGDFTKLPTRTRKALMNGVKITEKNEKMTLILAINYSSKWEIIQATRLLAEKVKKGDLGVTEIDEMVFESALSTAGIPNPEFLIRTSGELRISNFLLWQIAYTELYFSPVFWPDFRKNNFYKAIIEYQSRERRFGKISEQLV